jgi:hypothetical protein
MRIVSKLALFTVGFTLSACVTTNPATAPSGEEDKRVWSYGLGGPQLAGKKLDDALTKAEKSPLGSTDNPVRVFEPNGQRGYLGRLRCADGRRPDFNRTGNVGVGVFGNIIDLYEVNCHSAAPGKVGIYMDMYFTGAGEQRAVPGFTIIK